MLETTAASLPYHSLTPLKWQEKRPLLSSQAIRIHERAARLTHRLKQAQGAILGDTILTPLGGESSAALAAFSVANWDGEELTSGRRPRRPKPIIARPLTIARNGLRASVPFFMLKEDIDLLADGVGGLAESRRWLCCVASSLYFGPIQVSNGRSS